MQLDAAVESLRFEFGRNPEDRSTAELVTELRENSRDFNQWWEQHRVHQRTHGSKRLRHSLVGDLTVDYESLSLPGDPETTLYVYTTEPNSPSRRAMEILASWTGSSGLAMERQYPGQDGSAGEPRPTERSEILIRRCI